MLSGNIVNITGGHAYGNNHTIVEDNSQVSNTDTEMKLLKTLIIAGTGTCKLDISYRGKIYVRLLKNNSTWDYLVPEEYSLGVKTFSVSVTLDRNVNVVQLFGWKYTGAGGTTQDFVNTTFSAKSLNDPAIFRFMSRAENYYY